MTSSVLRVPIFPLPLVLLPRATQPLHVFEPRYRQLLTDCVEGTREFGMIYRTPEVAEHEIPAGTAGCLAHIQSTQALPDGRSNILVTGGDRFTLRDFVDDAAPYLIAVVERFEDDAEGAPALHEIADRLRTLFTRVGRSARAIQDDATPLPDLPADPAEVSFAIAQYIDLDLADKQRLLASRSPLARLQRLEEALAPVVESMERRAVVHTRARTNGHGEGHEGHGEGHGAS
ncbi:MAG: LON peptidase substrate-binding domain-containing protein [Gemmatimonadaceae bacterium]